jgi:hypothetical protein
MHGNYFNKTNEFMPKNKLCHIFLIANLFHIQRQIKWKRT